MLSRAFLESVFEVLRPWHEIAPGLSDVEFRAVEERNELRFPSDLRLFLQDGVPMGRGWPDWRNPKSRPVRDGYAFVLDGILFDIEANAMWNPAWGDKPAEVDEAKRLATVEVAKAPQLIPILGHRFMPALPALAGNPVFSIVQTDIIVYGYDLEDYLRAELLRQRLPNGLPGEITHPSDRMPRWIEFWSELTRVNNCWSEDWPGPSSTLRI